MESQNAKRQRIGENQNEEESNFHANRRDKTSGEDSSRMKNELRNMRKEMKELKSAIKDKGGENLDGIIQRTDSPFTTEVQNCPLPPKFHLPQLESYDGSKDPLDHIDDPKRGDVQGIPNDTERSSQSMVQQDTFRNYCKF